MPIANESKLRQVFSAAAGALDFDLVWDGYDLLKHLTRRGSG